MSPEEITKAWKDCAFRDSLSADQRAALPAHPAGAASTDSVHFSAETMMLGPTHEICTMGCCDGFTSGVGVCSWFCGSGNGGDTTYGCCTPGR